MKIGLIGNGYWGKIIRSKLFENEIEFIADSKFEYNTLLKNIDWAIVATPPNSHYSIVSSLLQNDVNVFCEKPLSNNLEEIDDLFKLATIRNKKLFINNIFLFRKRYMHFLTTNYSNDHITFKGIWRKKGPFKDDLFNDLLYHDIYLFLNLIEDCIYTEDIIVERVMYTSNNLDLSIRIKNHFFEVVYDRDCLVKTKTIAVNGTEIYFDKDDDDPLNKLINDVIRKSMSFDYQKNWTLSRKTIFLSNTIKKQIIK